MGVESVFMNLPEADEAPRSRIRIENYDHGVYRCDRVNWVRSVRCERYASHLEIVVDVRIAMNVT